MKFLWAKNKSKRSSERTSRGSGSFTTGSYVSRRPQPKKPSRGLYRRGAARAGSTVQGLKKLKAESIADASPRERINRLKSVQTKLLFGQWILGSIGVFLLVLSFNYTAGVYVGLEDGSEARQLSGSERDMYTGTIQSYYDKHPFDRFTFLLDREGLSKYVVDEYSEVGRVVGVGGSAFGEQEFTLSLRKPVASWAMSGETYFVDERGVAFSDNYYDSPGVNVIDNSGARSEEGDVLISSSFLGFVGRSIAFASQRGYQVSEVTIPPLAFRQVELTLEGVPYRVLMTTGRPAGVQIEDMDNAIKFFSSQGRAPRYIDVRVEGRAFFRE